LTPGSMKDLGVAPDDLGYMRDPAHAQQVDPMN
jgi:hypothetical protein